MKGELLRDALPSLARYLKEDGRIYLIEQVSDNPKIGRPPLNEYLQAFKESKLEYLQYYPIRDGRWWMLYLIRYGVVSKRWFHRIALWELMRNRKTKRNISYYQDYLFIIRRP
jgi:hypothetical protein